MFYLRFVNTFQPFNYQLFNNFLYFAAKYSATMDNNWFILSDTTEIDSPALLLYKDRVANNIELMLHIAGDAERLVPHVKTYKMIELVRMQVMRGISKFKCATIAEAEMTAKAGASTVIIAHQLVGPKIERWAQLVQAFPQVEFVSLVDCADAASAYQVVFSRHGLVANVLVDVNNAMDRSGHPVNEELFPFYQSLFRYPYLKVLGLHVYDGHFRDTDFAARKAKSDQAFAGIKTLLEQIQAAGLPEPMVIAGGSPAQTVHTLREGVYLSPGTCLVWDWGYGESLPDQPFQWAGLVLTRVISKPKAGYITVDLGHKAIAAENPLDKRVKFLNLDNYRFVSQSEEHLVLEVKDWEKWKVGDVLYGVPYHICPTINLYEDAYIIQNGTWVDTWNVVARKRKIAI